MLFNYSLSQNKLSLTFTAVAYSGFYFKHGFFLCEVRNECHVDMLVFKDLNFTRTYCTVITPLYQTPINNTNKTHFWGFRCSFLEE